MLWMMAWSLTVVNGTSAGPVGADGVAPIAGSSGINGRDFQRQPLWLPVERRQWTTVDVF